VGDAKWINPRIVDQDIDVAAAKLDRAPRDVTRARTVAKIRRNKVRLAARRTYFGNVFSPRSLFRPTTNTWTPNPASLLATARPMPLVAPVISALVVMCELLLTSSECHEIKCMNWL
jgi:hypothetical protein